MELKKALGLIDKPKQKHRPLTALRCLRGVICLVVIVLTAFMMLLLGFMTAVVLRLLSIHYSRRLTCMVFASWLALWPFFFEKINKTSLVFSGDTALVKKERVLLLANHTTEVDWMYIWNLALRKGCLGYIRYVLKTSLMNLPVFGWAFHILEFIPVQRKWEIDQPIMHQMLSTLQDPQDPLWLVIFPEGTDFTEQKRIRSQEYAANHGLPILNNVLLPRTKGFYVCLEKLRNSLDAVYDVTIGYKPCCPSFSDNVFGVNPSEVHMHIRRLSIKDIPCSEDEVATWLMKTFCFKDELLSKFYSTGHFPNEVSEEKLSTMRCLVNFAGVLTITSMGTFLAFFSTLWWIKLYVLVACVYLGFATKFNFRPVPILSLLNKCFRNQSMKQAQE